MVLIFSLVTSSLPGLSSGSGKCTSRVATEDRLLGLIIDVIDSERVDTMATPWVFLLLVGIFNLINQFGTVRAQQKPEYTLAFLGPAAASEIPTDLAIEW